MPRFYYDPILERRLEIEKYVHYDDVMIPTDPERRDFLIFDHYGDENEPAYWIELGCPIGDPGRSTRELAEAG